MRVTNILEEAVHNIKSQVSVEKLKNSAISFISLNNGAGAKTILSNIAVQLNSKYRICLFDANFYQPSLASLFGEVVTKEKSILNYFNLGKELQGCINEVKGQKNMWVVSTSPVDSPIDMASLDSTKVTGLAQFLKDNFDYLLIYMSYNPFAEWFLDVLPVVDKGYIIWDEHPENVIKTKTMLKFIHQTSNKATVVNNIIINKRTDIAYPYTVIDELQCYFISELPFNIDIMKLASEGKIYMTTKRIDKNYESGIKTIIENLQK